MYDLNAIVEFTQYISQIMVTNFPCYTKNNNNEKATTKR